MGFFIGGVPYSASQISIAHLERPLIGQRDSVTEYRTGEWGTSLGIEIHEAKDLVYRSRTDLQLNVQL
jgi:hypothetical protein